MGSLQQLEGAAYPLPSGLAVQLFHVFILTPAPLAHMALLSILLLASTRHPHVILTAPLAPELPTFLQSVAKEVKGGPLIV